MSFLGNFTSRCLFLKFVQSQLFLMVVFQNQDAHNYDGDQHKKTENKPKRNHTSNSPVAAMVEAFPDAASARTDVSPTIFLTTHDAITNPKVPVTKLAVP